MICALDLRHCEITEADRKATEDSEVIPTTQSTFKQNWQRSKPTIITLLLSCQDGYNLLQDLLLRVVLDDLGEEDFLSKMSSLKHQLLPTAITYLLSK